MKLDKETLIKMYDACVVADPAGDHYYRTIALLEAYCGTDKSGFMGKVTGRVNLWCSFHINHHYIDVVHTAMHASLQRVGEQIPTLQQKIVEEIVARTLANEERALRLVQMSFAFSSSSSTNEIPLVTSIPTITETFNAAKIKFYNLELGLLLDEINRNAPNAAPKGHIDSSGTLAILMQVIREKNEASKKHLGNIPSETITTIDRMTNAATKVGEEVLMNFFQSVPSLFGFNKK